MILSTFISTLFTSEKQNVIDLDDDESLSKDCKPGDGKHILFLVKCRIFLDITNELIYLTGRLARHRTGILPVLFFIVNWIFLVTVHQMILL